MKKRIILAILLGYILGCIVLSLSVIGYVDEMTFFQIAWAALLYTPRTCFGSGIIELTFSSIALSVLIVIGIKRSKPRLITWGIFIILLMLPIIVHYPGIKRHYVYEQMESGWDKSSSVTTINTSEIIRLLEEEEVVYVDTTHSQMIRIALRDGSKFEGHYVQADAGKYSDIDHFFDIYNLAMYIRGQRPEKQQWRYAVE